MNRIAVMLLIFLQLGYASIVYTVDTDRSGISSVTVSLEGESSTNISIPDDATNFRIVGGSYNVVNDTALISSGSSGFTTLSFSTSSLTTKTNSGWKLLISPPQGSAIQIYMPAFATIRDSEPQPMLVSAQDSRTLAEFAYSEQITVNYSLEEPQAPPQDQLDTNLLIAAIVFAVAIITAAWILKGQPKQKPEAKPTMKITDGKKEIMETFNENDRKIVDCLFDKGGKSKRNELERKTGISKSSLAMAINRLEKRKIIEIDRSSTTHFVKLSEYFLKL